jgi:2,5-furandicarboxylate decarboxylase 1
VPKDLRSYIQDLQNAQPETVVRVLNSVDPAHGLAEMVKLAEDKGNPVFVFEKVNGSALPVISGLYASRERVALALGVPAERATQHYLQCLTTGRPTQRTQYAPVRKCLQLGQEVNLSDLPVVTHAPLDSARYITAGVGLARDPETSAVNAGIYRLQILDRNHFTVGADADHDLGQLIAEAGKRGQTVPFAVVIGHHPAFTLASQGGHPRSVDSLGIAGSLLGESLRVVPGLTVDFDVPADAEIVIEGFITPAETAHDGPFGEFTYYYGEGSAPVCTATAIYRRNDAIYVDLHNAHVEHRCLFIHPGSEARLHAAVHKVAPSLTRVYMPFSAAGLHAVVVLRNPVVGEVAATVKAAFDHPGLMLKQVTVVDDDIDPADPDQVNWALATRFQADADLMLFECQDGLSLDPSSLRVDGTRRTTKLGLDATAALHLRDFPRADVTGNAPMTLNARLHGEDH